MNDFLFLIGQIFLITCVQTIFEMFIDQKQKPYLGQVLNIACYAGALYLLLQFVFNNVVSEMYTLFRFAF